MANCLDSLGLGFFMDSEEDAMALIGFVAENGKVVKGYYDYPYIKHFFGDAELVLNTVRTQTGLESSGFNAQPAGRCIWNVKIITDITPEDMDVTEKRLLVSMPDGTGAVVTDIIKPDVLPSFLEGDELKLQMAALAQSIDYFATEEEYVNDWPGEISLGDGVIMPANFLFNHNPNIDENRKDYSRDCLVLIRGTVKEFRDGMLQFGDTSERGYIRCSIDTSFGELELVHTLEQVKKEQYKNLRAGCIVSGTFILSGDAAIYEYENGIVIDEEHNLRLLRYTFVKGSADRLVSILDENAVYHSESSEKTIRGKNEIIEYLHYVQDNTLHKYFAKMAIIQYTDVTFRFDIGKRCIALASDNEDNIESIVFIEQNDEGLIKEIYLSTDRSYHFIQDGETLIRRVGGSAYDDFKDNTFSASNWSAPCLDSLDSVEAIRKRLNSFNLIGRKITSMKIIGLSYNLTRDWIANYVYRNLPQEMSEEKRQLKSDYLNIDDDFKFIRISEADEPLLIQFEDGNVFEIDTPQEPEFKFSMNCIPWNIKAGTNQPNMDANVLFDICLNKKITDIEIETHKTNIHPMYYEPLDASDSERELIKNIILWLEGDIGLAIGPSIDYCEFFCINKQRKIIDIPFGKLKTGLFNYEDLHSDEIL